jgi:iron complex transport system permease protein
MLLGFSLFPGVTLSSFVGSMMTLLLVLGLSTGQLGLRKDSLLLGGVMVNAFYSAVITFLISLSQQTSQIHHILFWLMGDFSMMSTEQWPLLLPVIPCFLIIGSQARPMNLLLLGEESAATMGVDIRKVRLVLLVTTSLMVSLVVCQSGLVGFVGLTIPHIFRMILGSDHRLLIPASILGGSSYLICCDLIARTIASSGEMPVGIITAMVGAPLFIFLLWRSQR